MNSGRTSEIKYALSKIAKVSIVVVIIIIVAAGGYFAVTYYNAPTQSKTVVSVGLSVGALDASDIAKAYAMEQVLPTLGPYSVSISVFDGASAVSPAILNGNIQIAGTGFPYPLELAATNNSIVIFGVGVAHPDGILICRNNVTQISQLATGHAIVEVSSITDATYLVTSYWLTQHGYNASAVQWKFTAGLAVHGAALLAGKIPCGYVDITSAIDLLAQPNHQFVQLTSEAALNESAPLDVWWTTQSFFNTHHDFLVAFMKAQLIADRWAQNKSNYMSYAPSLVGASINNSVLSQSYDVAQSLNMFTPNDPWNSSIAQTMYYFTSLATATQHITVPPPSAWANYSIYQDAISAEGLYS